MDTTDLRGAWLARRQREPLTVEAGGGSIVNIGSSRRSGPTWGLASTRRQKPAWWANRGIAADYGKSGIRCNVVHPGLIDSEQSRRILEGMGNEAEAWIEGYHGRDR